MEFGFEKGKHDEWFFKMNIVVEQDFPFFRFFVNYSSLHQSQALNLQHFIKKSTAL